MNWLDNHVFYYAARMIGYFTGCILRLAVIGSDQLRD